MVCCSKRITRAEENYGVSELEALAMMYVVTKLGPYLFGHQLTILTDRCALCALNLKESRSERLKGWASIPSSFNFAIKYIKGGLHGDVDCLLRAPVEEIPDEFVEAYALPLKIRPIAALATPCQNQA